MGDISFRNLLVVTVIAAAAPLLLGFVPRLRVPSVVLEIIAGIVVGPAALGWVKLDVPVQVLALLGLSFLLFLAGLEIDFDRLTRRLMKIAGGGWVFSLVLGVAVGFLLNSIGWTRSPLLVAIALSATSLGLVVPVLKDSGDAESELGQLVIAAASVADFGAILLLSLFFSTDPNSSTGGTVLL